MTIHEQAVKNLILTAKHHFFTVEFTKKSTGEYRVMNCRMGVTKHLKGGEKSYNDADYGLLTVYSMDAAGYRSIPLANVHKVKMDGVEYSIVRG